MANANKTQQTSASVEGFIAKLQPATKRKDCETLCEVMERVSGEPARMWGPSIIGFGVRQYRYESGREGEICKIGFSPRAQALTIYGLNPEENHDALAAIGKLKTGKGCIYIKTLGDIDLKKLETLMQQALKKNEMKRDLDHASVLKPGSNREPDSSRMRRQRPS
jgi:hypothetical protein